MNDLEREFVQEHRERHHLVPSTRKSQAKSVAVSVAKRFAAVEMPGEIWSAAGVASATKRQKASSSDSSVTQAMQSLITAAGEATNYRKIATATEEAVPLSSQCYPDNRCLRENSLDGKIPTVCCDSCDRWFHQVCVKEVTGKDIPSGNWYCTVFDRCMQHAGSDLVDQEGS